MCLVLYYGYQIINVHSAQWLPPDQLANKDFVCGEKVRSGRSRYESHRVAVTACENPNTLVEWVRANSLSARLAPPDQAIANENKRNSLIFNHALDIVDLSNSRPGEPMQSSPLVVHVLDTDNRAKDVPLLRVRPLNKSHKGETWYIQAASINRVATATDYAPDPAAVPTKTAPK